MLCFQCRITQCKADVKLLQCTKGAFCALTSVYSQMLVNSFELNLRFFRGLTAKILTYFHYSFGCINSIPNTGASTDKFVHTCTASRHTKEF